MKYKKKQLFGLYKYFLNLFFVIFLFFIIASSGQTKQIAVSNINSVKALESTKLVFNEPEVIEIEKEEPEYQMVYSVSEIKNSVNKKMEFIGTLTGYGPDCAGCSGIVGCPPYKSVLNGNITYDDPNYGNIRILAADPSIPCGSIIKIANYKNQADFIGIVLDRGSAIKGLTMDLLYDSEGTTEDLGRQYNIDFKIERWGF